MLQSFIDADVKEWDDDRLNAVNRGCACVAVR
jgi:hypothetical protein